MLFQKSFSSLRFVSVAIGLIAPTLGLSSLVVAYSSDAGRERAAALLTQQPREADATIDKSSWLSLKFEGQFRFVDLDDSFGIKGSETQTLAFNTIAEKMGSSGAVSVERLTKEERDALAQLFDAGHPQLAADIRNSSSGDVEAIASQTLLIRVAGKLIPYEVARTDDKQLPDSGLDSTPPNLVKPLGSLPPLQKTSDSRAKRITFQQSRLPLNISVPMALDTALEEIEKLMEQAKAALAQARAKVRERLEKEKGFSPLGLPPRGSFSDFPKEVQNQVKSYLETNYHVFGFSSSAEALDSLKDAVCSTHIYLGLEAKNKAGEALKVLELGD